MAGTSQDLGKRSRTNTHARLLAAALDVFCELGFQATTVEDICARAGFTRGAFYSNFSSIEELFLELWDQQADRTIEGARELVTTLAEMPDPLEVAQATLVNRELTEPRWFILNTEFFLHALRHPEVARDLTQHRVRLRRELSALMATLLDADGRTLPAGIDLELFTRMIIAAHEGCQHQSLVPGYELEAGHLQRSMLTLLITACPSTMDPDQAT